MALVGFQADYRDHTSISSSSLIEQEVFEEFVNEIEEGKIMLPDLALQRECAYVAKVTSLEIEVQNSSVSVQEPSSSLKLDRTSLENLSHLPPQPSHLRQTYIEQTLQIQPSENFPNLPPPQLQKAKQTFQIQSSGSFPLVPPLHLQKCKQTLEGQSSGSHPGISPLHLQNDNQTPQIQSSQNPPFIPLPQSQLQTSKQNFQIQSSGFLPCVPPPQLQTPKQILQIQTGTLPCARPPQLQQPYSRQTIQIQSSESFSTISQPQMQQSYTTETLKFQSLENPSRLAPIQMRHSYANRKSQIQPLSLVCKDCLVACSSASVLKQHYRGRKHRTRVQELNMQRNGIPIPPIQSSGIEPLWCDVCRIRCMNEDCFWQHLKGKKHADCVQAINAAKESKGEVGESSLNGRQGRFGVRGNYHYQR